MSNLSDKYPSFKILTFIKSNFTGSLFSFKKFEKLLNNFLLRVCENILDFYEFYFFEVFDLIFTNLLYFLKRFDRLRVKKIFLFLM